jgi:hypothetical protein
MGTTRFIAWVSGFYFVVDEPGVYRLQQLAGDTDRLWRVGEGGKRTLIACRASSGESGKKKKRTNSLAELNDEQLLLNCAAWIWSGGPMGSNACLESWA